MPSRSSRSVATPAASGVGGPTRSTASSASAVSVFGRWPTAASSRVSEEQLVTRINDCTAGRPSQVETPVRKGGAVSYTHLRAHETVLDLVCRLLLEKKK